MVAVAVQATGEPHQTVTVAERRLKSTRLTGFQASLRDARPENAFPWDESHGYNQISLREWMHKK
jgi:hypothetical protein